MDNKKTLAVTATVEIEDRGPWDKATKRFYERFLPAIQDVVGREIWGAHLQHAEGHLSSPHKCVPTRFEVRLDFKGDSWKQIRDAASEVLVQAARASDLRLEKDADDVDELGRDTYGMQGTQLVPA